jgi:hypothetical protein
MKQYTLAVVFALLAAAQIGPPNDGIHQRHQLMLVPN